MTVYIENKETKHILSKESLDVVPVVGDYICLNNVFFQVQERQFHLTALEGKIIKLIVS